MNEQTKTNKQNILFIYFIILKIWQKYKAYKNQRVRVKIVNIYNKIVNIYNKIVNIYNKIVNIYNKNGKGEKTHLAQKMLLVYNITYTCTCNI